MFLLEISGFPLFILAVASVIFLYSLFSWLGSSNGTSKSNPQIKFKEIISYKDCVSEAKWIISTANKRSDLIKNRTVEEIDFEYFNMDDEQRHYISEQKQFEIESLAKELYKKHNNIPNR